MQKGEALWFLKMVGQVGASNEQEKLGVNI